MLSLNLFQNIEFFTCTFGSSLCLEVFRFVAKNGTSFQPPLAMRFTKWQVCHEGKVIRFYLRPRQVYEVQYLTSSNVDGVSTICHMKESFTSETSQLFYWKCQNITIFATVRLYQFLMERFVISFEHI